MLSASTTSAQAFERRLDARIAIAAGPIGHAVPAT